MGTATQDPEKPPNPGDPIPIERKPFKLKPDATFNQGQSIIMGVFNYGLTVTTTEGTLNQGQSLLMTIL